MLDNNKSENEFEIGEVIVVDFSPYGFRTGPATVIGINDDDIEVCSGTSQIWHEGDPDFELVAQGEGGLDMDTYFQCTTTYSIEKGNVKDRCGVLGDNIFNSIREKVDDYQRR